MLSFLDDLHQTRAQVLANAEKTIDVVGTAGRYAIRYRTPTDEDALDRLTAVVAAYRVGSALDRKQEIQLVIDCCDEILRRDPDTGVRKRVPLPTSDGDPDTIDVAGEIEVSPLRFDASDPRWGGSCETAHDCVIELFNLRTRPLALSGVADNLVDWLQGIDDEITARVEGKSEAAPGES